MWIIQSLGFGVWLLWSVWGTVHTLPEEKWVKDEKKVETAKITFTAPPSSGLNTHTAQREAARVSMPPAP